MTETVRFNNRVFMLSTCITCGVEYAMPETLWTHQKDNGGYHTCPNGHSQGWGKDTCSAAALRRERDRLAQQIAQKDDELKNQRYLREATERQVVAAKVQITKLKKRASAGVCPCCNRTFANMAAHMKTKHPELDANVVDLGAEKAKRA